MPEHCWTLLGRREPETGTWRLRPQQGVPGEKTRVDADWAWTLAREESHGDVTGFFHTHPPGAGLRPSERDVRTMRAWCSALGKPLLCLIAEEGGTEAPRGTLFADDEDPGVPVGSAIPGQDGELTIQPARPPEKRE
jgi:hypothetical protein